MKTIEVDDELYAYIASQTESIGEGASDILRRLILGTPQTEEPVAEVSAPTDLFDSLDKDALQNLPKKVDQFLFLLSALHTSHSNDFANVEGIRGKGRLYFAQSEHALSAAGKSINAKPIPGSPYWVVTNNNSAKKVSILKQVMSVLSYPEDKIDRIIELFNP